jgi:hypothetical protein
MRTSAKVKRLRLNSETLRQLDKSDLEQAVGGLATNGTICPYSACLTSCNGCNTRNTCTTRYC